VDLGSAPEHRAVPALPAPRAGSREQADRGRADREWADPEWAAREWADREWTWPPGGPWHPAEGTCWATAEWAPATTVRRPLVRVGRWTLLYRRPGC